MEESLYQAEKNTEVIEKKLESILNDGSCCYRSYR